MTYFRILIMYSVKKQFILQMQLQFLNLQITSPRLYIRNPTSKLVSKIKCTFPSLKSTVKILVETSLRNFKFLTAGVQAINFCERVHQ